MPPPTKPPMKKAIMASLAVLAAIFAAMTGAAAAQDRGAGATPQDQQSDRATPIPPGQARPTTPNEQQGSASDKLSRSQGVLQPPATGDDAVKPPPRRGETRMPVIPPPGTPGGSQDIQPK